MSVSQYLGGLSTAQQLLVQLVENQSPESVYQRYHPDIASLGWLLGRSVFQELYWMRSQLQEDIALAARVQHLFALGSPDIHHAETQLPDQQHLLNWALEIHEQHLMWLANPKMLPGVSTNRLSWTASYLTQLHAQTYEQMIAALTTQQLNNDFSHYQVQSQLSGTLQTPETVAVAQGHYRIGARDGVVFDNEQPPQMVELHNFRIGKEVINNAEYLSFVASGGYQSAQFWSDEGLAWQQQTDTRAPLLWRQDSNGNWFGIGVNGAADLPANDPVRGISWHEASAYANWAAITVPGCEGAALAHEYQWEAAVRTQAISLRAQTLEWCTNHFNRYDQYQLPQDPELATVDFDANLMCVRGIGLHTLPSLHRPSYRHRAAASANHLGIGLRLILPPQTS